MIHLAITNSKFYNKPGYNEQYLNKARPIIKHLLFFVCLLLMKYFYVLTLYLSTVNRACRGTTAIFSQARPNILPQIFCACCFL